MQLLGAVQSRYQPAIPDDSPQYIVQLIQNCWKRESLERPNISEISQQLQGYLEAITFDKEMVYLTKKLLLSIWMNALMDLPLVHCFLKLMVV